MKDLLIIFIILLSLLILISTFGGSITNAHPETLVATPPATAAAPAAAPPATAPAAPAQPMPSAKASLSQMQSIEPFDNSKYFTSFA